MLETQFDAYLTVDSPELLGSITESYNLSRTYKCTTKMKSEQFSILLFSAIHNSIGIPHTHLE